MAYTRIKICGITRPEDALLAAKLGADAIGLNFYPVSKRYITIAQAKAIIKVLPPFITKVGLWVNADAATITSYLQALPLDVLQFHGQETAEFCQQFGWPYIKTIAMQPNINLNAAIEQFTTASAVLLDTYHHELAGGTGTVFAWNSVPDKLSKPIILAGGLHEANVATAIVQVKPYAVDVASGVEQQPGIKDSVKLKTFISKVRATDV